MKPARPARRAEGPTSIYSITVIVDCCARAAAECTAALPNAESTPAFFGLHADK
jgi:hypothetical protein